jgi:hypothetical protein
VAARPSCGTARCQGIKAGRPSHLAALNRCLRVSPGSPPRVDAAAIKAEESLDLLAELEIPRPKKIIEATVTG